MLPKVVQTQTNAVASYDYSDLAENTGVQLFYLAKTSNDYIMTQNQIYSNDILASGSGGAGWAARFNEDFDLTSFNAPQGIRGSAVFSYGVAIGSNVDLKTNIVIKKYDGTTATTIASLSGTHFESNGASTQYFTDSVVIPMTAITSFKKGEILRIGLAINTSGSDVSAVGIDPMNRTGGYFDLPTNNSTSQFKCYIPFNLDL